MDFVLPGETRSLAKEIAGKLGGALYVLDDERQTMRIVLDTRSVPGLPPGERFFLDFAAFRAENLEGDLWDRDFTINAMAWNVARPGQLIDPTGGRGIYLANGSRPVHHPACGTTRCVISARFAWLLSWISGLSRAPCS
jgi:hypothetical protein